MILVTPLNRKEICPYGLKMKGAFSTVVDALVLGIDRNARSRKDSQYDMLLITFDGEERELVHALGEKPYAELARQANSRIGVEQFRVGLHRKVGDDDAVCLVYSLPSVGAGNERIVITALYS